MPQWAAGATTELYAGGAAKIIRSSWLSVRTAALRTGTWISRKRRRSSPLTTNPMLKFRVMLADHYFSIDAECEEAAQEQAFALLVSRLSPHHFAVWPVDGEDDWTEAAK